MGAATDLFLGKRGEPALDLVDPGSGSQGEMNVKAGMASKSLLDVLCSAF